MLIHHNKLRVNADVPDEVDMDTYRESGWASGKHKDTDPDDPSPLPRVLPVEADPEPEPEPAKPARATTKEK